MRLQWPLEYVYEPQTQWDVHTEWRWRGWLKPKGPRIIERIEFDNGVVGYVYSIPGVVPLWPSIWRHPIRHVRMKRAVREYEKMLATPMAEKLREKEDGAFLFGVGS